MSAESFEAMTRGIDFKRRNRTTRLGEAFKILELDITGKYSFHDGYIWGGKLGSGLEITGSTQMTLKDLDLRAWDLIGHADRAGKTW
jgi:hypothetical protein